MAQVGDRVTYRNREAIVTTVHADDSVNLVFGTPHSDTSDGIWPVEAASNVPATGFDVPDDQSGGEDEDVDDDADTGDVDDASGDTDTDGEDAGEDAGEDEADFDADAFVDRTPVTDVATDIRSGDYDDRLDAIEAAERDDRDRDTVYEAIESRR